MLENKSYYAKGERPRVEREFLRLDWISGANFEGLNTDAECYNEWAEIIGGELLSTVEALHKETRSLNWYDDPVYGPVQIKRCIESTPLLKDFSGSKVLDIGGTCQDSWRFVWYGGARLVEQVEPSVESQRLGYKRIERLFAREPRLLDRFTFNTTYAESMPFKDDTFDVVFSRSTIHHTRRPDVFYEIRRVLKPGGVFWMLEPRHPMISYYFFKLTRVGRKKWKESTHDPLRAREIEQLGYIMDVKYAEYMKVIETYLIPLLGNARAKKHRKYYSWIDDYLTHGRMGEILGHYISLVVGKK